MATITREEQARLQRERVERAVTEEFGVVMDSSGEFAHVFSAKSGTFYRTSEQECSCKDWQYRCAPKGLFCKHQVAVIARQEVE